MSKKKIITLALVVMIAILSITSASLAYFTDTKTAENTFTMGNVKITLDETDVTDPNGDRVTENEYDVYPGAVVTKDPIVHNTGKNGAYIRVLINVENWMNVCAALYPDYTETFPNEEYKNSLLLLVDQLGAGWSIEEVTAGDVFTIGQFDAKFVLKYDGVLASGADTTAVFEHVKVPTTITNATSDAFGAITIVAQAIQSDGFDSWEDAFTAFDAE